MSRKHKLTRPQRVLLYKVTFVMGMLAATVWIWGASSMTWKATPTGATETREFGLVRFLMVTTTTSGPMGFPTQQKVVGQTWDWRPAAIAANAGITLVVAAVLWVVCRLSIRRERLVGRCDECGYDLTGQVSAKCPECGTPTPAASPGVGAT